MKHGKQSYAFYFREYVRELSRICEVNESAISKKRTYEESFGAHNYETERYGQEIGEDFFATKVGHGVMG